MLKWWPNLARSMFSCLGGGERKERGRERVEPVHGKRKKEERERVGPMHAWKKLHCRALIILVMCDLFKKCYITYPLSML